MSDGTFYGGILVLCVIASTCNTVHRVEDKVDAQGIQMQEMLNECRASKVPHLEAADVELPDPPPEDPCACAPGELCMCQGTGETD